MKEVCNFDDKTIEIGFFEKFTLKNLTFTRSNNKIVRNLFAFSHQIILRCPKKAHKARNNNAPNHNSKAKPN